MFVLLEGVSGVGKSTVAEELCRLSDFKFCPIPQSILSRREQVHRPDTKVEELYEFYKLCVQIQSNQLGYLQSTHQCHFVMVRYWPSALAYHLALKKDLKIEKANFGQIAEPDLIIHLHAHAATIRSRQEVSGKLKNPDPAYEKLHLDPDRMDGVFEEVFTRWPIANRRRISTTRKDPQEVRDEILSLVPFRKAA